MEEFDGAETITDDRAIEALNRLGLKSPDQQVFGETVAEPQAPAEPHPGPQVVYREPSVADIEKMLEEHVLKSRATTRHLKAWLRSAKERQANFEGLRQKDLLG
jgi:hypothetical protein